MLLRWLFFVTIDEPNFLLGTLRILEKFRASPDSSHYHNFLGSAFLTFKTNKLFLGQWDVLE